MAKTSGITVRIEQWTVLGWNAKDNTPQYQTVNKLAVRHSDGRFHGATNFPVRKGSSISRLARG